MLWSKYEAKEIFTIRHNRDWSKYIIRDKRDVTMNQEVVTILNIYAANNKDLKHIKLQLLEL